MRHLISNEVKKMTDMETEENLNIALAVYEEEILVAG